MSSEQTTVPVPYIVSATNVFDGDDGAWSTFAIRAGTPSQSFRVLPNIVGEEIWLPVTEGCVGILSDLPDCGNLRGVNDFDGEPSRGFQRNSSSSWQVGGIYQLNTQQNLFNGPTDQGYYGQDTVALGTPASTSGFGAEVSGQIVAGIATEDYWLGSIGLGTFTSPNNAPSLLVSMKEHNLTTSLSYGYTAGQSYASPKLPGSLILGGYDQARLRSSTVTVPIDSTSPVQELQINLQQILASNTLDGSSRNLLDRNITMKVDSATSWLWLPEHVCDLLAQSFGLNYDNSTGFYLVNSTIHLKLQSNPPSIAFTLGGDERSSGTTNVVLNYNALNLSVGIPLYNTSTPYFPIRRAVNASQYTLGRTFLQEAYIIVDWERANFTVGQVMGSNAASSIVPLLSPSDTTSPTSASHTDVPTTTPVKKFPTGAIAGIVVVVIALTAIAIGAFLYLRRRRNKKQQELQQKHGSVESTVPEYHTGGVVEHYPPEKTGAKHGYSNVEIAEVDDKRPGLHERKKSELSDTQVYEMEHGVIDRQLMSTPVNPELMSTPIMELEGSPYVANELDVGYGRTDDPTPPETGAAMTVRISAVTPRLIGETACSPRRFTLQDAPYEDEPEDRRDRVVSDISDLRPDCRSPDFSDSDISEPSPSSDTLHAPPRLRDDIETPAKEHMDGRQDVPTPRSMAG